MDRTTLGSLKYMLAPRIPFRTDRQSLGRRGSDGLIEFPVTVTPGLRLPFFATFLISTGLTIFQASLKALRAVNCHLQFQFHLSDFVDYGHSDLADQVPFAGKGQYVPLALRVSLDKKLALFRQVMDSLALEYEFMTLKSLSQKLINDGVL